VTSARPKAAAVGRRLTRGLVRRLRPSGQDPFAEVRAVDGPVLVKTASVVRDPSLDDRPSLVILLPNLQLHRMTGGPNTALNLGARIAARGVPVRFVATHGPAQADHAALRDHVATLSGLPAGRDDISFESAEDPATPLRLGRKDVLVATWWPTAYVARAALAVTEIREFLYLIQDFEPGFYAWSTNYALALATYDFPIRGIFNESLLRSHFVSIGIGRFGVGGGQAPSIAFEPAVDRALFRAGPRDGPRRLLFYARPRNPRNAFELGLRALRLATERGAFDGDWEFAFIGDQVPDLPLAPGREIRALPWQSLAEYAALLGRSDVLLSLMLSPHTSYPPLEMAAAGGAVVTNTFGVKTQAALAAIAPTIRAVEPEVEALAAALATAAGGARSGPPAEPASEALALPDSWSASFAPVIDWVLDAISELRAG